MFTGSKYLKAVDKRAERGTPGPSLVAVAARQFGKSTYAELLQCAGDVEVLSARVKELEAALSAYATAYRVEVQRDELWLLEKEIAGAPVVYARASPPYYNVWHDGEVRFIDTHRARLVRIEPIKEKL